MILVTEAMLSAKRLSPEAKRLDEELVERQLVQSRSQGQRLIKLGRVKVNGEIARKSHFSVTSSSKIEIVGGERYVSRAGFKLASVAKKFSLDFTGKTVLDVGSSTGGFTDYSLQHGADKVIAVDVGTNQLHPTLKNDKRIELHEKTDIRNLAGPLKVDIVLIDVSFISLRDVLPAVSGLIGRNALIVAMFKPQFEGGEKQKNKGIIKNDAIRRQLMKDFEAWLKSRFVIMDKADSGVAGSKGNKERFYLLKSPVA